MTDLYQNSERRLDSVGSFTKDDIRTWSAIKRANTWFMGEYLVPDISERECQWAFELWLKDDFGIQLTARDGGYSNYEILDQDKYLLFLLKFVK